MLLRQRGQTVGTMRASPGNGPARHRELDRPQHCLDFGRVGHPDDKVHVLGHDDPPPEVKSQTVTSTAQGIKKPTASPFTAEERLLTKGREREAMGVAGDVPARTLFAMYVTIRSHVEILHGESDRGKWVTRADSTDSRPDAAGAACPWHPRGLGSRGTPSLGFVQRHCV